MIESWVLRNCTVIRIGITKAASLSGMLFILLACCSTLAACQGLLPTPANQDSNRLLFQDDFSDTSRQWLFSETPDGFSGIDDGVLRLATNSGNADAWARPGLNLQDIRVEVNAIKINGDRNNRFGILCRVQDANRYYVLLVSSDGYYGIGKVNGNNYQLLGSQALLPSELIPKGNAFLRLRGDCVGDRLALFVNDQLIQEVRDGEYSSGDVGLMAGTYSSGTEILFDDFRLYQP